jgi:diguanylate cyclase (GGDEF)-like protein/PAS domain S-box-containing protein
MTSLSKIYNKQSIQGWSRFFQHKIARLKITAWYHETVQQGLWPFAVHILCGSGLFALVMVLPATAVTDDARFFLPLHTLFESCSVAAALMIFTMGWFAFSHVQEARFQVIACAFLSIGTLDFLHILSFPGMPDFVTPSSFEKAVFFWLPARFISAVTLLSLAILPGAALLTVRSRQRLFWGLLLLTMLLAIWGLGFSRQMPQSMSFMSPVSLAHFKTGFELICIAITIVTLERIIHYWRSQHDPFLPLLFTAALLMLFSQATLTSFGLNTHFHHLPGLFFKAWGYGLLFWGVYSQAMEKPYYALRQAQQLLLENESKTQNLLNENRILLDNNFVGIFFVKDRYFIRVNKQAETLFRYPPGYLNGVSTRCIYAHYDDYIALGQQAYPLISQGQVFIGERELVRADGERFWCLMRGEALQRQQPNAGSVWIMEDITQQHQIQQASKNAAQLYRAIFESRDVSKLLIDPQDGKIIDANQAAAQFYGTTRDQLQSCYLWQFLILPRDKLLALFANFKTTTISSLDDSVLQHRDAQGQLCDVGLYCDAINLEDRALLLVTLLDLTAQKQSEKKLQQSEKRFRDLFTYANVVMLLVDPETTRIVDANHAACDYYQYSIEQLCTMCFTLFQVTAESDMALQLKQTITMHRTCFETQHRLNSGEQRDVQIYAGRLDLEGRVLVHIIVYDITQQKAAEQALRVSLHESQRHHSNMVTLNRMNDLLLSCETRDEVYLIINRTAERLFHHSNGCVAIFNEDDHQLHVVSRWGTVNNIPDQFQFNHCWALRRGEAHEVFDLQQGAQCQHFLSAPTTPYLCLPLTVNNRTVGLFFLDFITDDQVTEQRALATIIRDTIKLTLANLMAREALHERAVRDGLTGLFNRRYLDERLEYELRRHQQRHEQLAVAMLDVDHFKRFNDRYGHDAGDIVLQAISQLLLRSIRSGDQACRYGGEELTLILPGASLENAQARLEMLRQAVASLRVNYQQPLPTITVSIGVTECTIDDNANTLINRADAALLQAKRAGRNQVVAFTPSS